MDFISWQNIQISRYGIELYLSRLYETKYENRWEPTHVRWIDEEREEIYIRFNNQGVKP